MKRSPKYTAVLLGTALALMIVLAPAASAGDGKYGTSAPVFSNKVKSDASGQSYSWRDGGCWGNPGTWSTFLSGRTYTCKGPWSANPSQIRRGMGLKPIRRQQTRVTRAPKTVASVKKAPKKTVKKATKKKTKKTMAVRAKR